MTANVLAIQPECQPLPEVTERHVSFRVGADQIQAILTLPTGTAPRHGVIFTHGWSGNRCGPAAIITTLARRLAQNNCASLRFDFRGRGESAGNGLESTLTTMADDLVEASRQFAALSGIRKPVYTGLCSGGNVAIGALNRLPDAKAIVMLSVYPFSDGDAFGRDARRTLHFLKVYWLKATRPETWKRLWRGDVNLKQVAQVILNPLLRRKAGKQREGQQDAAKPATPQVARATQSESRLQPGQEPPRKFLANLRPGLPGLFIYGTGDPDAKAAIDYYGTYITEHSLPIRIEYINGANHNFSSQFWFNQVADLTLAFLDQLP